jgi:hypothetical protein
VVHPLFINTDAIHFAKYPDSGEYHENWLLERGSASQARLKLGVDSASALAIGVDSASALAIGVDSASTLIILYL